ncbi:MAG TPA: pyridoxamine 5'-phosphate oxidase family protein [Nitrosopumilaceae archaeon]|nr:pyridoxamine 5'-phosphate oxidase family protein [Nitrosopumilaceae archaeon]
MVRITPEVQEMLRKQKFIVVGSVDLNGLANLSPRTSFTFGEDTICWLDFFKHKSHINFKSVPWVSVAVFDAKKLKGFQLKGKVTFVTDPKQKSEIVDKITRSVTGATSSKVFERMNEGKPPDVVMFKTKAIYSLSPEETSGVALVLDTDGETVSLLGI